ncbi:MAG: helix-turn-helix transcriptional regulator [Silicimonas sp.]|nr:helix-turn-helix transcriptional regulator [Silicimonas sp.]
MESSPNAQLDITRAASTFAALGSEQRLAVLRVLVRAGPEGLAIGALGKRSGVTGSTLTHHMKILAAADLVEQVKDGRRIICIGAAYDRMQALSDYLLQECCKDSAAPDTDHSHG